MVEMFSNECALVSLSSPKGGYRYAADSECLQLTSLDAILSAPRCRNTMGGLDGVLLLSRKTQQPHGSSGMTFAVLNSSGKI